MSNESTKQRDEIDKYILENLKIQLFKNLINLFYSFKKCIKYKIKNKR